MRIALFLIAAAAYAQQPGTAELIDKWIAATEINNKKSAQYAYREHTIFREVDKDGKETGRRTETWEVIGLEGSTYRKLVQRDGMPLSPKEQKKEDERLAKETAKRRKETPEQRRNRLLSLDYGISFTPRHVPRLFDVKYLGSEMMDGRLVHVLECNPKTGLKVSGNDKELLNYQVKVWLDPEHAWDPRMEMLVITDKSRMRKGSKIINVSERHEDGTWLAKELHIVFDIRFFKLIGEHGELHTTYSDYQKFEVDSFINFEAQ